MFCIYMILFSRIREPEICGFVEDGRVCGNNIMLKIPLEHSAAVMICISGALKAVVLCAFSELSNAVERI